MNKEVINTTLVTRITKKIKDFEKEEWHLADLEHYGKSVDFTKKKHKFVAKNNSGNIIGMLDLAIEVNLAFVEGLLVSSKHRKKGGWEEVVNAS